MEQSKLDLINAMIENESSYCGDVSDGYHTFTELYEHRNTLVCALIVAMCANGHQSDTFWSRKHHDGTMFSDYIIVGIKTPKGNVTYHMYDDFIKNLPPEIEVPFAPEWDGHTSKAAKDRLQEYFRP